ncbi:hypothetical protein A6278_00615 [Bacillus wiedmannii]|uniref:hypothetical protein n=1 Tax=Bacillus wiedmannii TaxID=1890302 RepID=UPI0007DB0ED6|nr:hypothetical protein [Bacillus wiedmannii]OAK10247.1 hypothetical protein A6278_00615 [Bacillus wiedmannii]
MKITKKILILVLSLVILLNIQLGGSAVYAAVDVQAPTFNSITVDKKEVKPGDRIKISIDAVDHESGIKTIALYYKTPITGKNEYVGIYYNPGTGRYEGTLTIPDTFEPGLWKISSIYITDNANNELIVSPSRGYDLSGAEFRLSGAKPDVQAPTFNSISVDKKEVKPGDRIKISIDAVDNESGIWTIALYYKTPITGKNEYVGIYYNPGTGRYEGTLTIPDTFEPGLWKISSIYITDNANNELKVSPSRGYDLSDAEFKVRTP